MELVRAIREDADDLMASYCASGSLRYDQFCESWNGKAFHLLFTCKPQKLLTKLVRELLDYLAQCVGHGDSLGLQAGALYALYGVYVHQSCSPKVKVRLTPACMGAVKSLCDHLRNHGNFDAAYAWSFLVSSNAILVSALPFSMEYNSWCQTVEPADQPKDERNIGHGSLQKYTRELVESNGKVEKIILMDEEYNRLKKDQLELTHGELSSALLNEDNEFVSFLTRRTDEFCTKLRDLGK